MKKIQLFYLASCPYCRKAMTALEELRSGDARYGGLEIEMIEEREQAAYADSFDYYYVPTFYVGGEKKHEGAADLQDVRAVLDAALDD